MGEMLKHIQSIIVAYQTLILSLGVPLLSLGISWFVSFQSNKNARLIANQDHDNARAIAQRDRIQSVEIKLAEFRQTWINELRADLAEFSSLLWKLDGTSYPETLLRDVVRVAARIRMRMNQSDPDYEALMVSLGHFLDHFVPNNRQPEREGKTAADTATESVVSLGQRILKREWERLKEDLRKIEFEQSAA